jgi:hypothetical protein
MYGRDGGDSGRLFVSEKFHEALFLIAKETACHWISARCFLIVTVFVYAAFAGPLGGA